MQGQNITAGVMAKNLNTFYKVTTPTGIVWATSKGMTVTHSKEKKIIGWDIMKLISHCGVKRYCFEKVFNVVCIDGHENDPLEIPEPKSKEAPPKKLTKPNKRKK